MPSIATTICTHQEKSLLEESAEFFHIPLTVLQKGEPWVNWSHNKLDVYYKDIQRLDPETVFYIDSRDAIFVRPDAVDIAKQALTECGHDFLVGGDKLCWPWPLKHRPQFPKYGLVSQHANAGCWIATRNGFDREFQHMLLAKQNDDGYAEEKHTRQTNDQIMFNEAAIAKTMAVDISKQLVLNINELNLSNAEILWKIIQIDGPAVLHGPSTSKDQVISVWSQLKRLYELQLLPRYDFIDANEEMLRINSTHGLQDMLRHIPPLKRVAEIGSFRGVSTEVFCLLAQEVYSIDNWEDGSRALADFELVKARYKNLTSLKAYSTNVAKIFPNGFFDLVYIDANHSYESVLADIEAWMPKIKVGGWISGHDYINKFELGGLVRAVDEMFGPVKNVFDDKSWFVQLNGRSR